MNKIYQNIEDTIIETFMKKKLGRKNMSQETFQMIQQMDLNNIETQLALQCAPLLAGIKISNLFIVSSEYAADVEKLFRTGSKKCFRLYERKGKTTFLMYHEKNLYSYLQKKEVQQLFQMLGYHGECSLSQILSIFQKHYADYCAGKAGFPHEMGLFLGYPVEDVYGFMVNEGKKYLYAGYWKVYKNLEEKKQLFQQYNRAKEQLVAFVAQGNHIIKR